MAAFCLQIAMFMTTLRVYIQYLFQLTSHYYKIRFVISYLSSYMFRPMKGFFRENLITVLPEDGFHGPKHLRRKLRNNIEICMNLVSTDTV